LTKNARLNFTLPLETRRIRNKLDGTWQVGSQHFASQWKDYLKRKSLGIGFPVTLYVFDVNDELSLESLDYWIEETAAKAPTLGGLTPLRFLIGNKIDTPGLRKIDSSDAREFAEKYDMKYYETWYALFCVHVLVNMNFL
jgi:hypothetical protein